MRSLRILSTASCIFCLVFALVLLLAPVLARAEEPVTIATIAAKTGDASTSNAVLFQTVRFAVDELNAGGGLLGRRIEILELDNESTAIGSAKAAKEAVAADVAAVIGASWSSHSSAMAPVLQAAKIPMISPISTNPGVTLHGDYIFRACYTDPFQGRVMARFAREDLKARTAVTLVNVDRTYSTGLADYFERAFAELGGAVLWRGEFLIDNANYAKLLAETAEMRPDVLYVPGDYRDSAYIIKQAREMGLTTVILGGDAFGMRIYDYVGAVADGCFYTTNWHRDTPNPVSRDFVARYEAKFGEIKQTTIPLTYDATMLWANAVKRAGSFDRVKVREALAATDDFVGTTGPIRFDANGDPFKEVVVNKMENQGITFIRSVAP